MKKYNYSNEIANVVKKFLTDDDWHYSFDEERGIFDFGLRVRSKIQKIKYLIDVKEDEMVVYGICPIGADRDDEKMMAQMAEFICRANFGLKNGCFEFDFRDGEIRYKSFIDCDEVLPSTEVVKNSIHCTAAMYKRYAAGITSIIFAGSSAKEAIAMCEKSPDEELRRVAEDALRALPNKGNADLSSVRTIVSELKIRIQASSWLTKFKKQLRRSPNDAELHRTAAEAHVVLDDWPSALKEFAKAGPDWAKGVEGDSAESATPELIADFWWRMADSTKNRALEAAYRRRAATYYQKALDKNLLNGLLKMRAERRVAEVSSLVDFCALLREKVVKPSDVKSYVFNLTGTGPCLERMERIQESGAEKFKTDKLLLNRIPDGIFQMGLVAEDSHSVKISRPFWAGVYLVTHAQWGHVMPPRKLSPEQVALGGEKAAVVSITRQEVEEFCQKLTEKAKDLLPTGYVFRLPTIAEDEYILQAGNTDMSVFDFRAPSTSTFRLRFGVCEEGKKQILAKHGIVKDEKFWKIPANHITVEVGLREPNDWGIYDCWGNGDVFLMDVFPKDTTTFIKEMKKLPWKDEADPFFWSADGIDGCSVFHVDTRSASGSRLFWMCLKPRGNFKCLGFRLVLAPDLVAERNALKKN